MTESQLPPTPPPVEPIDYAGPRPPAAPLPVETDKDARTWAMRLKTLRWVAGET